MKGLESFDVKVLFVLLLLVIIIIGYYYYWLLLLSCKASVTDLKRSLCAFKNWLIYDNIILKVIVILMDRIDRARIQRTRTILSCLALFRDINHILLLHR